MEVYAEILRIAKNGVCKTKIMQHANLNYAQLSDALSMLTNIEMLEERGNNGSTLYARTKKGDEYLDVWGKMTLLLE